MKKAVMVVVFGLVVAWALAQDAPRKPVQEPQVQAAAAPIERYLPPGALMFLKASDVSALRECVDKTSFLKIWREKEVQNVLKEPIDQVKANLEQGLKELEKETGFKLADVLDIFRGEVSFTLIDFDPKAMEDTGKPEFDFVLSVDTRDKKEQMVKFLEAAQKAIIRNAGEDGPAATTCEYKGQKIYGFGDEDVVFNATWLGTRWVMAIKKATLQGIIDRSLGAAEKAESLETQKDFAAARQKCGAGKESLFIYYDTSRFLNKLKDVVPAEFLKMYADMGLLEPMAAGYGAIVQPDGTSKELSCMFAAQSHKLLSVIGKQKLNTTLFIPSDDIILWASASFDLMAYFNLAMNAAADSLRRQGVDAADFLKNVEEFTGLKLDEEVLKALEGTASFYIMLPQGGGAFPELALVLGVAKNDLLDKAVEKFAKKMGEDLKTTEHDGSKICYFSIDKFVGEETDAPYWPAFASKNNLLLAGSSPQTVKRMLMYLEKPPEPAGDLKAAIAAAPKDAYSLVFADLRKGFGYLYNTLLPYVGKKNPESLPEFLLPGRLPPAEVFSRHLSCAWGFAARDAGGFYSEMTSSIGPLAVLVGLFSGASAAMPQVLFRGAPGAQPGGAGGLAGEGFAIAALRTLSSCQAQYVTRFGAYAATLRELADKGLIDADLASGVKGGYLFEMNASGAESWKCVARPLVPDGEKRYLYIDTSGVIRASGTPDVGPSSEPLK